MNAFCAGGPGRKRVQKDLYREEDQTYRWIKRGQASKYNSFSMRNNWTRVPQLRKEITKREMTEV